MNWEDLMEKIILFILFVFLILVLVSGVIVMIKFAIWVLYSNLSK